MGQLDYVAVIEIGSGKIRGLVGRKNSDESIQVLSYAFEPSSSFIRKGVVYNIDKTAQALTSLINKLEGNLDEGITISRVYVGFGGKSMRTEKNSVLRTFDEEIKISQEILESIIEECRQTQYNGREILATIPQNYKLETYVVNEPVGVSTRVIEGHFLNLIANRNLKERIEESFRIANIDIAEMIISPFSLAESVLTETDKRAGCVLVDFGYDTTTVSIYKNKILRNLTVLPLGGNNITMDLANVLKLELDDAEELKLVYGTAFNNPANDKEYIDEKINLPELERVIDKPLFDDIVVARTEEIVENVVNVIKTSGYDSQLFSGVVVTGAASRLRGLTSLLEERCKDMKVKVVKNNWNLIPSAFSVPLEKPNENDTLLSLLCSGTVSCCNQAVDQSLIVEGRLFNDAEEEESAETDNGKTETNEVKTVETLDKEHDSGADSGSRKSSKNSKGNSFFNSFITKLFGEDSSWDADDKKETKE